MLTVDDTIEDGGEATVADRTLIVGISIPTLGIVFLSILFFSGEDELAALHGLLLGGPLTLAYAKLNSLAYCTCTNYEQNRGLLLAYAKLNYLFH